MAAEAWHLAGERPGDAIAPIAVALPALDRNGTATVELPPLSLSVFTFEAVVGQFERLLDWAGP